MKKIILITGASRGIGRDIAKTLSKDNNNIVIANYNKSEKEAIELKERLKDEGIDIEIIKADVSKRNETKKMVDNVLKKYGKIDVLINNAGISQYKLFNDITDEEWDNIMNTNLTSAFMVTQEAIRNMINNKQGCIINISSIWGVAGAAMEVAYSTSKAGLIGLTKSLAKELGPSNIRVNAIAPGFIDTGMNNRFSEDELQSIKEEIPLERMGDTADITKCVKWLIEDSYTTGQVISINGGWDI